MTAVGMARKFGTKSAITGLV